MPWHIEQQWAWSELGKYLSNIQVAKSDEVLDRLKQMNAPAYMDAKGALIQVGANTVLRGAAPPGSVLRLNLFGPMLAEGDWCSWGMYDYEAAIQAASDNPNVDGVFIRANTGGGEAISGQILHNAIKSSKKAVVVYAELLASAGVHGTLAADEIIAAGPQSRIGSIGTYASIDKEFLTWYQENVDDIYADVSPEKNNEFRQYLAGNSEPLRKSITENAKIFQQEVRDHRPLGAKAEDTLKGGMFFASDAKKRGLVDGTGDMNYALTRLQANINKRKKR